MHSLTQTVQTGLKYEEDVKIYISKEQDAGKALTSPLEPSSIEKHQMFHYFWEMLYPK